MFKLSLLFEEQPARALELKPGTYQVGRTETNDIQVDHPTVSSHHCELVVSDHSVLVKDLSSTNGTFINDHQIAEAELLPGYYLRVGDVEVFLQGEPAVVAIPTYKDHAAPEPPEAFHACANHRSVSSAYGCPRCQLEFCALCVHQVKRVGGNALLLCPQCSGPCHALITETVIEKKSLWKTLRQAIATAARK